MSSQKKYQGRSYSIQEYDPLWAEQYEHEATAVLAVLGDQAIAIEHISSTAVPSLAGKPLIDILVVVKDITTADTFASTLTQLGFTFLGQYVMEGSRLFVKESDGTRTVNLHCFAAGHPHVQEMLGLRDYLRSHPETVAEYSDLKFSLATKYPNDYGSYRKHKDEWMRGLMGRLGR